MLTDFFYLLRAYGLKVSLNEWNTLLEGLDKGLHESTLTGFYYLARAVLIHSEADFDKFDQVFLYYFKGIESYQEIPQKFLDWVNSPVEEREHLKAMTDKLAEQHSLEQIRQMFEEKLRTQTERHDGGMVWIGTGGSSHFGNSGYNPKAIRVGGTGGGRSALQIASQREFRDFREDTVLDMRQFQMAFRRLRQFSTQEDGPKDELQLERTIQKTCDNAGHLELVFDRPRRNSVKLLLLFDSGGSMWSYTQLCNTLFQAARNSHHFKDLQVYYFHNCIYDVVYTHPSCREQFAVPSEWVLNNLKQDYKVIAVGDAAMAPYELLEEGGFSMDYFHVHEGTGIGWLTRFKKRYDKMIWLNPTPDDEWEDNWGSETIGLIRQLIPMYPLTVKGLEEGLRYLIRARQDDGQAGHKVIKDPSRPRNRSRMRSRYSIFW